ncbi:MAG: septum formation initiator family protein [Desulfuromonas sp.]|nr:septum formation initiator family protein [Desulfuromonas sp.]
MTSESAAELKKSTVKARSLCLAIVAFVGLGFALFGEKGALRLHQVHQHQIELTQQFQQLQHENSRLRNEIDSLSYDDRYIEQVARSTFNLVRDGEVVYQFAPTIR